MMWSNFKARRFDSNINYILSGSNRVQAFCKVHLKRSQISSKISTMSNPKNMGNRAWRYILHLRSVPVYWFGINPETTIWSKRAVNSWNTKGAILASDPNSILIYFWIILVKVRDRQKCGSIEFKPGLWLARADKVSVAKHRGKLKALIWKCSEKYFKGNQGVWIWNIIFSPSREKFLRLPRVEWNSWDKSFELTIYICT